MKDHLFSAWSTPPRKPDRLRQDTWGSDVRPGWNRQDTSQWWYHTTNLLFWERGQSSGRGSAPSVTSRRIPSYSPPFTHCKKSLHARGSGVRSEWRLQDKKDCLGVTSSSVTAQDSPRSYLEHTIRKEGLQVSRSELKRASQRPVDQADLK